jgi:putative MATE family efflux protein
MNTRDSIVSGPIFKTIWSLAMPVVAGMFVEFALSVTDFFWVGKLGPAAQDAITSTMVVIWTIFAVMNVITIGVTALVSRHVGAQDFDQAAFFTRQGLVAGLIAGILLGIVGYIATPAVLRFMGAGETTLGHAIPYLRIFFLTAVLFFVAETTYAAFRASGDTRTPMIVGITSLIINIVLDPVLIFGWGPAPELGVPGASIATAIAMFVGMVWILILLVKGRTGYSPGSRIIESPKSDAIKRITRIGVPISSQQLVFIFVYFFLIRFVHEFGETAGAAMGIGNRMESFSYLTCYGFSVAASTLVGQNLGAKLPDRAAKCAWGAVGIGIGLTSVITVIFLTIPHVIAGIFTDDPIVLEIAIGYIIILGISQMSMAAEIILEGAFSGSGDTIPPMIVLIPGSLARIPLAWLLAFELGWGINGVWWTLTITTLVKAGVLAYWFGLGHWKKKKI